MTPSPLHILLVEDSPEDAELIIRQVRRAGFEIDWTRVETESEFLAHLRPDLDIILSDYTLPQFNAPRALELLQQSQHDIPFIIISGTIGEETAVAAMRQGASDYLLKDRLTRLDQAITAAVEKNTQRRLRAQAELALRESQDRFQLLANTITEVFWISSADLSEFHYVSPGYQKIWGHPPEVLYSNPRAWYDPIVEEDRAHVDAATHGDPLPESLGIEYRILHPDGTLRWINARTFPVHDVSGHVVQLVGVASDITDRRELEAEYRQAQKMEALGQLAAGVAQDFNNLLTVIAGNTSLIQQSDCTPQNILESTSEILMATNSASRLTKQLLMFSRKNMLHRKPTNLARVVDRLSKMLKRIVGEDIAIDCRKDKSTPMVLADEGMLEQVLVNLVVNARDAMSNGGELTIETSLQSDRSGSWVHLAVTDNGAGISPEVLPRLFEPFFTTKEAGKGTGLGLATVFAIVDQHHGRVEVESEVGRGTTFHIHLPSSQATSLESAPAQAEAEETVRSDGGETILVVEDDVAVRKLILRFLKRAGYTVHDAEAGPAALDLWKIHAPQIDLLLTDMVLPGGMTGFQIAERIREDSPDLPVLFSSGYSPDRVARTHEWQAGYHFLEKPYEPTALIAAVRKALGPVVPAI